VALGRVGREHTIFEEAEISRFEMAAFDSINNRVEKNLSSEFVSSSRAELRVMPDYEVTGASERRSL